MHKLFVFFLVFFWFSLLESVSLATSIHRKAGNWSFHAAPGQYDAVCGGCGGFTVWPTLQCSEGSPFIDWSPITVLSTRHCCCAVLCYSVVCMVCYGMVRYGMIRYATLWYGMVRYGLVWYIWYVMGRYGVVWYATHNIAFTHFIFPSCPDSCKMVLDDQTNLLLCQRPSYHLGQRQTTDSAHFQQF